MSAVVLQPYITIERDSSIFPESPAFWLVRVYPSGRRERVYRSPYLGDAHAAAEAWKELGFRVVDNSKAGLQ